MSVALKNANINKKMTLSGNFKKMQHTNQFLQFLLQLTLNKYLPAGLIFRKERNFSKKVSVMQNTRDHEIFSQYPKPIRTNLRIYNRAILRKWLKAQGCYFCRKTPQWLSDRVLNKLLNVFVYLVHMKGLTDQIKLCIPITRK